MDPQELAKRPSFSLFYVKSMVPALKNSVWSANHGKFSSLLAF
jgi:hypothetical protein